MPAYQYIYVMKGLGKTYPGGREVLKDIWLSLSARRQDRRARRQRRRQIDPACRSWPAIEKDFSGEAWAAEGVKVGYLPQEPALDPKKDVAGNVTEGLGEIKALLDRFEAVSAALRRDRSPDDEMNALHRRAGRVAGKDRRRQWLGARPHRSRSRWTRCAARPAMPRSTHALGRRAPARRAVPPAAAEARSAAARRADQPSRRRIGRLAAAFPRGISRHRRHRHPRPLFPRRGGGLDPRTRSRPRHSLRGQLFRLARAEAEAPRAGRQAGGGAPAHARARAGMGQAEPARAPGQEQGAPHRL